MPSRTEVEEWAERYRRAWSETDPDAAAALFTENATYRSNVFEEPHAGRAGITAYWSDVTSSQRDVQVEMGIPTVDGHRADVEFWTRMVVDGAQVTLAGCLLLTFGDDGLCSELREYWNVMDGDRRPPSGWGA